MICTLILCAVQTLGFNVASVHERPGFNNVNPGVYAVTPQDAPVVLAGGVYLNSHSHVSVWAARKWETPAYPVAGVKLSAAVLAGVITGYGKPSPLVSPSVALHTEGITYRVSFAPRHPTKSNAASALHLSLEVAR